MPLGDHLGTHKHLGFSRPEALQDRRGPTGPAIGIRIKHIDLNTGIKLPKPLLHPLCARSHGLEGFLVAGRTLARYWPLVATVVTHQPRWTLVEGQGEATVVTAEIFPTGTT